MWIEFLLENLHFSINMLVSLAFFSVFWLYFDAWVERKKIKDSFLWIGYILLSISFLLAALQIESTILPVTFFSQNIIQYLMIASRVLGYIALIISLLKEPILSKPNFGKENLQSGLASGSFGYFLPIAFSFPILSVVIAFLYLRRATVGLENHIKPISLVFFMISISEILSLSEFFASTQNVYLYSHLAPFGTFWILQLVFLFISSLILGKWIFGYLLKRFQSQLFMIFVSLVLVIFLLITVSFTAVLLRQLESDSLEHLSSDAKVLNYSIQSKKAEVMSYVRQLSQGSELSEIVASGSASSLQKFATIYQEQAAGNDITITNSTGTVLARSNDSERVGDSLSGTEIVKRAIDGKDTVSIVVEDGVLAPLVSIQAASPIKVLGAIEGIVIGKVLIDDAFVDNLKKVTDLDASVYGVNYISATTLLSPDGKTRITGINETRNDIISKVLNNGEIYSGRLTINNIEYLGTFIPLKDIDNSNVGMIFVGKESSGVIIAAGKSIEITFILAVILLIVSIFPAYIIARYISSQIK